MPQRPKKSDQADQADELTDDQADAILDGLSEGETATLIRDNELPTRGVHNQTGTLLSWDPDLHSKLENLIGPCEIQVRPIGYSNCSLAADRDQRLGKRRHRLWAKILGTARTHLRTAELLEAGFTADEIHELGLCNLSIAGERNFASYTSESEYAADKARTSSAERDFAALPAWIRARFRNSVGTLIGFLRNPLNDAESTALGLERNQERYLRPGDRWDPSRGLNNLDDLNELKAEGIAARERLDHLGRRITLRNSRVCTDQVYAEEERLSHEENDGKAETDEGYTPRQFKPPTLLQ